MHAPHTHLCVRALIPPLHTHRVSLTREHLQYLPESYTLAQEHGLIKEETI